MIYEPKCKIDIQTVVSSRLEDVDFSNLPFGRTFTDHMFECEYKNGK